MAERKINIRVDQTGNAKKGLDGILGSVGKLGLAAGAVAIGGIAALAAGLYSSVEAASEAQDVEAQLNAVLKSTNSIAGVTAKVVKDLASKYAGLTKFEDEAILSGENMLLTFTNIGKDVFPDATLAVLNMSQALGQDTVTSAMQLGKALNDPIKGITALRRVGIQFTQAQEEAIGAMVAMGDTAGAQKLILAELTTEFGGSAEAAGSTFAGKLTILKNKFGDVKEYIGGAFLPVLSDLADKFIGGLNSAEFQAGLDSVVNWITTVGIPGITNFATKLGELGAIGSRIVGEIITGFKTGDWSALTADLRDNLWPKISEALTGFGKNVAAVVTTWATAPETKAAIEQLGEDLGKMLSDAWAAGIKLDFELSGKFDTWVNSPDVQKAIRDAGFTMGTGIIAGIKDAFTPKEAGDTILTMAARLIDEGHKALDNFRGVGDTLSQGIIEGMLSTLGIKLPPAMVTMLQAELKMIRQVMSGDFYGLGKDFIDNVTKAIQDIGSGKLQTALLTIVNSALAWLWPILRESLARFGRDIVKRIAEGMAQSGELKNVLRRMATEALQAVKDVLGIHSPSAVFAEIGRQLQAGLEIGIKAQPAPMMQLPGVLPTGGGGAGMTVVLNYQPTFSLADQFEAERILKPFILPVVRAALEGRA